MKLRNKKTGEIGRLYFDHQLIDPKTGTYAIVIQHRDKLGYEAFANYFTLAELNEEWGDAPDEEWRDVLGFEELYQVSNLGHVRTVKRGEATVMAQEEQRNGYLSVHLRNKGIERRASVHRLVAEAFIPNPDGLRDVNHKNGVKTDNRLENLEWMSHSDNMKHQYQVLRTGRYGHLYEEPKPLIKNAGMREVLRLWAKVNLIPSNATTIEYHLAETLTGTETEFWDNNLHIMFYGNIAPGAVHGKIYTIAELCGEETPEPLEPTFVDLDERIREKEDE